MVNIRVGRVVALFWAGMTNELRAVYCEQRHWELRSFAFDMRFIVSYYVRHLHARRLRGARLFNSLHARDRIELRVVEVSCRCREGVKREIIET